MSHTPPPPPPMPESFDHPDNLPADLAEIAAALHALAESDTAAAPHDLAARLHAATTPALSATPADLREVEARVDQLAAVYSASAPPGLDQRIHTATAPELRPPTPALRLVGAGARAPARERTLARRFALPAGLALAAAVALVAGISFLTSSPRGSGSAGHTPANTLTALDDTHLEAAVLAFDGIDAAILGEDVDTLLSEAQDLSDTLATDPAVSMNESGAR